MKRSIKKPRGAPKITPKLRLFLRDWRKYRSLTQDELAEKAGVTQAMISHLENGSTDFGGNTLADLAAALDCSVSDLLTRRPTDPEGAYEVLDSLSRPDRVRAAEMMKGLKRVSEN